MDEELAADCAALAEFRYALRRFLHFSREAAKDAGISPQQHQALLALQGFGGKAGLPVGQLARRLDLRPNSAVEQVDRLARRGLACRHTDPQDRRCVRVVLTARGERVLARLSAAHRDELRQIGPELRRFLHRLA